MVKMNVKTNKISIEEEFEGFFEKTTYSNKFDNFNKEYPFKEIYTKIDEFKLKNIKIVDFATGDPIAKPPKTAISSCIKSLKKGRSERYPNPTGSKEFIKNLLTHIKKVWKIKVSENNICSSNGVKEAIFSFVMAFTNPGDYCIIPTPAYPIYKTATIWAGAKPYFVPLLKKNDYLIDFNSIPKNIIKKTKIIFINYPNNPTGKIPDDNYYKKLVLWAKLNNIIIVHDEVYKDFTKDNKPAKSILNFTMDNVISFYSLSKIYAMQGWRIGFVVGDEKLIKYYKKYKIYTDSGTPTFIQDASSSVLSNLKLKTRLQIRFKKSQELILNAFRKLGWEIEDTDSTFYVWQKIPNKFKDGSQIMARFIENDIATLVLPGNWITESINKKNIGKKYIRIACISNISDTKLFVKRILKAKDLYV